ncbi:type 2 periplasmic-binding domain-containing protein [Actinomadura algeriensis]|uniref:Uncharacterized protein n=1 Tax=Actinomadura algeriensis TaxID=1679523 RepID=A0ABR9JYL4_9ACTN|nr:hypothetical protein [Actinomadura algeriensis]MBE1535677.1 hypothetical protein [Actinomadura algeriensis]
MLVEWASGAHTVNTRRGWPAGPMDARLAEAGPGRRPAATVPTVAAGLFDVRESGPLGFAAERLHRRPVQGLGLVWVPVSLEPPLVPSRPWRGMPATTPIPPPHGCGSASGLWSAAWPRARRGRE